MKSALRAREYRYVFASNEGPAGELGEAQLRTALGVALTSFFGAYGLAEVKPKFISYDRNAHRLLVRCSRGQEMRLCAALSLIPKLEGRAAHVRPLRIAGTIASIGRKEDEKTA